MDNYKNWLDKYLLENEKRIFDWYIYADQQIQKMLIKAIQNLIDIGYSSKEMIMTRILTHYSTGAYLDPAKGLVNFSFFWDKKIEKDFESLESELISHPKFEEKYFDVIHEKFENVANVQASKMLLKYQKIEPEAKDFIKKLLNYHLDNLMKNFSELRKFTKKNKSKDLEVIFSFLEDHKSLPETLTINSSSWGIYWGKEDDDIFEYELFDSEDFEIQVEESELIKGTEDRMLAVMFIFKDKALRDKLNIILKDKLKKITKLSNQIRTKGDKYKSYYIECPVDWRTF